MLCIQDVSWGGSQSWRGSPCSLTQGQVALFIWREWRGIRCIAKDENTDKMNEFPFHLNNKESGSQSQSTWRPVFQGCILLVNNLTSSTTYICFYSVWPTFRGRRGELWIETWSQSPGHSRKIESQLDYVPSFSGCLLGRCAWG